MVIKAYFGNVSALIGLGFVACVVGCGSDESGSSGGGNSGSGGTSSASCAMPKAAECFHSGVTLTEQGPQGIGVECMAKKDNSSASLLEFRVSQLRIRSPATLAQPFMQDPIITARIDLNQPACYQHGKARYNLLFEFDTATKLAKSGGGPPQFLIGPPTQGTCYVDAVDPASQIPITPSEASYTEDADGTLRTKFDKVVVPIYLSDEVDNYVLMPLSELAISAKLSADKSCIGRFRPEALDPTISCAPKEGQVAWENGGTYEGYITVEEADRVEVHSLNMTLCVVLTGETARWKGPQMIGACNGSPGYIAQGNQLPAGDYCPPPLNEPASSGTCSDGSRAGAWKVKAEFAASAMEIKGTYGATGCSG